MSKNYKISKFKLALIIFVVLDIALAIVVTIVVLNSNKTVTTYNTAEEYEQAIESTTNPKDLAELRMHYVDLIEYKVPKEDVKVILDQINIEDLSNNQDKITYYRVYREYYTSIDDSENYERYNKLLGEFLDSVNLSNGGGGA